MQRKVGVVLSGCGYLDGSEIHEAVLTLLMLDEAGVAAVCMAPSGPQRQVVDHVTREPVRESRDVLKESARIARGRIRDIATVGVDELDALLLPGGFGAAKNLCDFAERGAAARPHAEVARLLRTMHAQHKPIGALCIAPALVACVLGREAQPVLTIGDDQATAGALAAMGAVHRESPVDRCVIDERNRIVTAPAYMYDARIADVAKGIRAVVGALLAMLDKQPAGGAR